MKNGLPLFQQESELASDRTDVTASDREMDTLQATSDVVDNEVEDYSYLFAWEDEDCIFAMADEDCIWEEVC